jgi:DnaJ homolog subfamily C member 19
VKFLITLAIVAGVFWAFRNVLRSSSPMTVGEAAKVLEVALDANSETINAAHKRLIAKVHPDAGGSAELAARVNQARDILLRRIR